MVRRVLVADDNPDMRKMICRVFQPAKSFDLCAEAANGEDAVALARLCSPHLVILDLSMSVMSGIEAARIIHKEMPDVPITLYTLHADAIPASEAAIYGIRRVVPKDDLDNLVNHAQAMFRGANTSA
jgi:DNA-binding NarL/FixJ family response regulator